jgi:hypothetical protein
LGHLPPHEAGEERLEDHPQPPLPGQIDLLSALVDRRKHQRRTFLRVFSLFLGLGLSLDETVAPHGGFQTGGIDHHHRNLLLSPDGLEEAVECEFGGAIGRPSGQSELAREGGDDDDGSFAVFEVFEGVFGEIDVGVQIGPDQRVEN